MSPLQHHNIMPPPSATLRPKVDVVVISRNAELAAANADLSLVIVALVGGNRPAISSEEVQAHLCAWLDRANRGPSTPPRRRSAADGHDPGGIVLDVPDRTDRVESAPDPMELEARLAARSSDVPLVSRALGNVQDSAPTTFAHPQPDVDVWLQEPAHESVIVEPVLTPPIGDSVLDTSPQPVDCPEFVHDAAVCTPVPPLQLMPVDDFISSFRMPLSPPVLSSPPRLRVTRSARARTIEDAELVPKRSARLAAKSKYREQKPEAQARKVMMKRLGIEVETQLPDEASFEEFQTAFKLPLSQSTREAMLALFPGKMQWASTAVRDE
jgi:hypothetical protein